MHTRNTKEKLEYLEKTMYFSAWNPVLDKISFGSYDESAFRDHFMTISVFFPYCVILFTGKGT